MATRYDRQLRLPQFGRAGQDRLRAATVLLVGCGALGTTVADLLARAGVGRLRIVDRDVVELSNLHRQTLFDEADARAGVPKAVAATRRLAAVNGDVTVEPLVVDLAADNVLAVMSDVDLVIDGTDNAATRYLLNDAAVRLDRPWVYGACVGTEGRVMTVIPGQSPCLRCLFERPPDPGELPTCDTVGVLGSVAALVAAWQATAAIQVLSGAAPTAGRQLLVIDAWAWKVRSIALSDARRADCPCCAGRRFEFLERPPESSVSLCGRDAVQVRPGQATRIDLDALATRLRQAGTVERTPFLLRLDLSDPPARLTVFPDGRAIVHGTTELARARSLYDRFVGA
jgi:adenylyltransferase/sulfurtransferase